MVWNLDSSKLPFYFTNKQVEPMPKSKSKKSFCKSWSERPSLGLVLFPDPIFARISAMTQVNRTSLTRDTEFFWLQLISCDKNFCHLTRKKYILLWLKIIFSGRKAFFVTWRSKDYKAPASPWITLSRVKYWTRRWGSHEAEYFQPPWQ